MSIKLLKSSSIVILISMFINGCSLIGVGHNDTYCAEHGCDYSDAGVCGNSWDIYKHFKQTKKRAYNGYSCRDRSVK